jgi:sugar lactone lactonase YvrE
MPQNGALRHLLWLLTFFQLSVSLPLRATTTYPLTVIGRFAQPHTFENIATRHNGQLLLTSTESSTLYHVDPLRHDQINGIIDIPQTTGLLGIAELEEDVFYVISANLSSVQGVPGSNAIWRLDMRGHGSFSASNRTAKPEPRLSLVANISSAQLLNGMCRLSDHDATSLLISDSQAGRIFKLDAHTGSFQIIIDDEALKLSSEGLQVAVNGIHVQGSYLFFTNYNKGIFGRIPISSSTGIPTGPVEVIVQGVHGDDFAVSTDGKTAWIAMNGRNRLVEVDIPARSARVVAESSYLASASAVAFGRTLLDRDSLYISSAGVLDATIGINSNVTGGIVARVDLV